MTNAEIAEQFFDHDILIDKIIWMAALHGSPSSHDDFVEFIEYEDNAQSLLGLGKRAQMDDIEELASTLARKKRDGFLVRACIPVPIKFHATGATYSWGSSTWKWFYADAVDGELAAKILAWKEADWAQRREKAGVPKEE